MEEVPVESKPKKNAGWWTKLRYSYRSFPDKKQYIEFFTALLTVPVLLTVILLNVNNLRAKDTTKVPTPTASPSEKIIYISPQEKNTTPVPSSEVCKKELPPVEIRDPQENETVTDNPVSVTIYYPKANYCAIVWAYRVNNGRWSDYDDKSLALYNLPKGKITLDLRVKSIVTTEETTLKRIFTYDGSSLESTPTLSPTPIKSGPTQPISPTASQ